ncbi:retrovirus-related pol polyprotein from transposon TNT 1-94, partial [Tanacetum coccineum]
LGYQNPFSLKKAQRIKPTLYDGSVISSQHAVIPVIDEEETLILEELNQLSEDFGKRFIPQQELSAEQAFWLQTSNPNIEKSDISPIIIEAPSELPKDVLLTIMNSTTVYGDFVNLEMQSSEWCDKCFDLDAEFLKKQNAYNELLTKYFENNDLKARLQAKDTTICKLKEHIKSMRENDKEEKVKQDTDEIETINIATVRFGNDQIAKITRYGYYQLGNVLISKVYYVEGLGHNLFSVGQYCDADLEVAFRKNTCFIRNLEGVDLLSRSRDTNLYTISLDDMLKTSPISLLSKASKTKSWLWHCRLSHLNFGTLNKLAKDGLARSIPKLKFQKDHLCSACALGKSKKSSHQLKAEDINQEKLYLLHMDLYGPMRVVSINGKKYILVVVDNYSRFTWVKFLRSKDVAPDTIIKYFKNIQAFRIKLLFLALLNRTVLSKDETELLWKLLAQC